MKANELMVGDWVLDTRTNNPLRVNPFLVEVEVPEWQPIPLTKEILEKNEFERVNAEVVTYRLTQYLYWVNKGLEYVTSPIPITNIRYVHELQHLLKLCGIDKEIVV